MAHINHKFLNNHLCYFKLSAYYQILIYGDNAEKLINYFSTRNLSFINSKSFYTILMNKKKYLDEVIIIKYSNFKYLIISQTKDVYINLLSKSKIFSLTSVNIINDYSIYSLHGNYSLLNKVKTKLYPVNRQGYSHYIILLNKNNPFSKPDYFNDLYELTIDNYNFFLYNNNVLKDFNIKNKKIRLNVIKMVYDCDNIKYKIKPIFLIIKKFESTLNFIPKKGNKILNSKYKKIGYIHHHFRLKNKKNPFLICIILKYRFQKKVFVKDKYIKNFIILKHKPLLK